MEIKDGMSAKEFANSWQKEASPAGAARAIRRAIKSQRSILAIMRSYSHFRPPLYSEEEIRQHEDAIAILKVALEESEQAAN